VSDEPVVDEQGRRLDRIALTGIGATGHHGVHQFERDEGQPFLADVVLHLDTRRAAAGDDLARTIDYGVVARRVHAVLAGEPVALIETVAERIAATVLADAGVHTVDVTVHKPQAPVEVPFEDVSVSIRRDRTTLPAAEPYREAEAAIGLAPDEAGVAAPDDEGVVDGEIVLDQLDERPGAPVDVVLAIGGNLGPVAETLRTAVHDLTQVSGLEVTAVSPLARTAAVGGPDQPDFLNAVVLARTTLAPREVLRACQGIENAHGRERSVHWGPRTLDVDVIVYDSVLAVTDDLELPHPRAHQRAFVLQPWAQADPEAVLPGLGGGPVAVLAETAPDRDGVRWLALDWLTDPIPTTGVTPAAGRGGSHAAGRTVRLTPAVPVRSATSVRPASASASAAPGVPAGPGMSAVPPSPGMSVLPPLPALPTTPVTGASSGWAEPWSPTDPAGTAGRVEPWSPAADAPAAPTSELAPWPPMDSPTPLRPASPVEPWSPPAPQDPADSERPADQAAPAGPEGSTDPEVPTSWAGPTSPARPVGPTGTAATPIVSPWEP
jgi:dihydroneopterin aldolase/2-amino-4-hydroxy-6-hydroxymethyldihydropteridine diphosphokinase